MKIASLTRERLWKLLLLLRTRIRQTNGSIHTVRIQCSDRNFNIDINPSTALEESGQLIYITKDLSFDKKDYQTVFHINDDFDVVLTHNALLEAREAEFLSLYIPFCFWAQKAHLNSRSKAVLHLAQTLDGRIATRTGHSKWISNQEDLLHAHRMRALCDAVLIGSHTLMMDRPALTVRHVEGPDPVKIVIGNSNYDFSSLLESKGKVLFITGDTDHHTEGIENLNLRNGSEIINPETILETLYSRKIYSVYIEGGSMTASVFLSGHCVDLLQLFVSPRILGSGITNFNLPSIQQIGQSMNFRNVSYTHMGEGMLFQGNLLNDEPI